MRTSRSVLSRASIINSVCLSVSGPTVSSSSRWTASRRPVRGLGQRVQPADHLGFARFGDVVAFDIQMDAISGPRGVVLILRPRLTGRGELK